MIAGQKIRYLDGTRVFPGGYLHGYITTNGQYCNSLPPVMVATSIEDQEVPAADPSSFRIYPNPATDRFTLEILHGNFSDKVSVVVYGSHGNIILSDEMTRMAQKEFSLSGKPSGLYFVRVIDGNRQYTRKLLKQ